jgi:hypothetical protein
VSVVALRDGEVVGSATSFKTGQRRWDFDIDLGFEVKPDDILKGRLSVFAFDRLGRRSALELSGATQLAYLKEAASTPPETELVVDFSHDGNSRQFIREGWYVPARDHTWTKGLYSNMELPIKNAGSPYTLEILARPFVKPEKISGQNLAISVNDFLLTKTVVLPDNMPIECEVPADLTGTANLKIRFDHPDAVRPSDFWPLADARTIALAFKVMKLRNKQRLSTE